MAMNEWCQWASTRIHNVCIRDVESQQRRRCEQCLRSCTSSASSVSGKLSIDVDICCMRVICFMMALSKRHIFTFNSA